METSQKSHRIRRASSIVVIVIVSVLAPLVVTSGWAITTVTNTDRFVATMSALGRNTTITDYVAVQGATAAVDQLKVQARIAHRLPAAVAFLAPLITTELTSALTKGFTEVLRSATFQSVWNSKIRLLHSTFIKLMTTNPSKAQHGAKLVLDFTPQILQAFDKLDAKGITVFDPLRKLFVGNQKVLVQLVEAKQFKQAQWYFNVAIKLRWILPLVLLVLGAIGVLLDRKRRRSGTWLSAGIALSCVLMLVLLAIGKSYAMSHAATPPDVADAVISSLTSYLRWELRVVAVVAAAAALLLWVTGPSARARSVRRAVMSTGGAAARKVEGAMGEKNVERIDADATSVLGYVGTHATAFIWGGVAIACIALLAWVGSLAGLLWTAVFTGLWIAGILATRRRFAPAALAAHSSEPQLPAPQ